MYPEKKIFKVLFGKNMKIKEIEMSHWELSEFNENNFLDLPEQNTVLLIWMPLKSYFFDQYIDGYILNIIAPQDTCFWNFELYNAFRKGKIKTLSTIKLLHQSKNILVDFIKETGREVGSFFAEIWMQDLTMYFGNYFAYKHLNLSDRIILHMSHRNIFVPFELKPYLSSYFVKQIESFGESAFLECDFERLFYFLNNDIYSNLINQYKQLFNSHIARLELAALKPFKHDLMNLDKFNQIPKALLLMKNCESVNFGYVPIMKQGLCDDAFYTDLGEIFLARVNWVINHSTIYQLENIKYSLSHSMWGDLALVDLRNELRKKVDIILADFPIIQTNPYELFDSIKYKFIKEA